LLQGVVVLFVAGSVSVAWAQMPGRGRGMPAMYDTKSETTIKGTVENVQTMTGAGNRGAHGMAGMAGMGTHLTVKTDTETFDVRLGPASYLEEKKIALAKGDAVEILGSKVTMGGQTVIIARQVTKGDNVWIFRDESGRPLWSGRGRRR
jgi:hypothetical protein